MKWTFIILLVVNIVFFAWQLDRGMKEAHRQPIVQIAIPTNVEKLKLIKEEPHQHKPIPEPSETTNYSLDLNQASNLEAVPIPNPPDAEHCLMVGPFTTDNETIQAASWFADKKSDTKRTVNEHTIREQFHVFLESKLTMDETIARTETGEGMNGVGPNPSNNRISVGVFSSQEEVNNHLAQVEKEGYQPLVEPHHISIPLYWLAVKVPQGRDLNAEARIEFVGRAQVKNYCEKIATRTQTP